MYMCEDNIVGNMTDCNKPPDILQKLEELHVAVEGSGAVCVLVQGPSGCGKSCLLQEYATLCGRTDGDTLMVVHLGEQIDSKVHEHYTYNVYYHRLCLLIFFLLEILFS